MNTPRQLKSLYQQGTNITALLREEQGLHQNTQKIIETAYDLQAGSYVAAMEDPNTVDYKRNYTSEIAKVILSLCEPKTILEAGVGEATTLSGVLQHLNADVRSFGFDLSWSRISYARRWLQRQGISDTVLCTGNLFDIPFADHSIDVVYTSHSIEPNGGNEGPILRELLRVTRKFLVLLEPGYELANEEARNRMDSHGYCKNLQGHLDAMGCHVIEHKLFPFTSNPLNPTAITIIKKSEDGSIPASILACPKFKTPLLEIGGALFSPEALVVYPIVGDIPCLRIENGIFASAFEEHVRE